MRIAVVCSDLGVRVPGPKGASVHLVSITSAFREIGHEVMLVGVAGHGPPPPCDRVLLLAHPGRSEGLERERRKIAFTEDLVHAAQAPLAEFRPDIVYERLALFGTAGSRLAAAARAIHVVEVNALLAEEELTWRGLELRDEATARECSVLGHADLRVAVSIEVAADVDRVAPGGVTAVVPNGVDLALFSSPLRRDDARRALGLPADRRLVVFTGALRPWHGVDVALRAVAELPDDVDLMVAGTGDIEADLRVLADHLGIGARVHWLGQRAHADIPMVLAAADAAVAPYPPLAAFGFSPLKLYEYLAAGVPVVASRIGQVTEALADGRFGALVEPGDFAELAVALRRVLDEPAVSAAKAADARRHALAHHGWTSRAADIVALATRRESTPAHALVR
jgi:glycosyltransferase involved in cell wall biosynthesis